ncbi:MAG: glycosyltransferase [Treponema sp.]|nr:glycosyltransferase [Treponema sp.]
MKVSVIIPTYCTPEEKLRRCLESAVCQTLPELEIIVVDDNAERAPQKAVEKIIRSFKKESKAVHAGDIRCVCHGRNLGLAAARRTGVEEAAGVYVTMLDSDDEFRTPDACRTAYDASCGGMYDFVQFCAEPRREGAYILEKNKDAYRLIEHPFQGECRLSSSDAFAERFLTSGEFCLFLWGKLIKRETFTKALERIPVMDCFMAEDLLYSYFTARESFSYIGIPDILYSYNLGNGISTSSDMITTLDRWEKLCSPALVFTAVMYDLNERPSPAGAAIYKYMRKSMTHFVVHNCMLLNRVQPELRGKAHEILEEAWGPDIIHEAETNLREKK